MQAGFPAVGRRVRDGVTCVIRGSGSRTWARASAPPGDAVSRRTLAALSLPVDPHCVGQRRLELYTPLARYGIDFRSLRDLATSAPPPVGSKASLLYNRALRPATASWMVCAAPTELSHRISIGWR